MFANAHYLYATSFDMNINSLVCSEKRIHKCNFCFGWLDGWHAIYCSIQRTVMHLSCVRFSEFLSPQSEELKCVRADGLWYNWCMDGYMAEAQDADGSTSA